MQILILAVSLQDQFLGREALHVLLYGTFIWNLDDSDSGMIFFFLWWLGETGKCPDNYSSNFQNPFCLLFIWVSPILVSIHLLSSIPSHTLELHPSSSCSKIKQKYDLHVVLSSISFGCFLLFSSALGTSEVKQVSGKPHLNLILTINDPAQFWRKTQWSYISSFEIPPPQVHQPVMTVRG